MAEAKKPSSQSDKFKQAARELGCYEDEAKFDAALKEVAKHKPMEDPSKLHGNPKK